MRNSQILFLTSIVCLLTLRLDSLAQNALHFRAESDTVRISNSTILDTTVTIEAIVKFDNDQPKRPDPLQPFQNIFVEDWVGQGSSGQINFGVTTSGLMGFAAPNYLGDFMTLKEMNISQNEWHHAAYVIDSTSERLYLDGNLVASRPSQNQNIWESTTSSYLGYGWLGYLSSFRISNVARYTGVSYVKPDLKLTSDASTLLLYNFETVSGDTIVDESGNGRHGTLGGSTPRAVAPVTKPALISIDTDGDGLTDAWERGVGRYQVIEGSFAWTEAKADAENRGGHLATITSQAEWDSILAEINSYPNPAGIWLGGTDELESGVWKWITGETWSFTRWSPGEPNDFQGPASESYLQLYGPNASWTWNDLPNSQWRLGYLLEFGYPTDPNDPDSDDDGYDDKVESDAGTDPNNAASTPMVIVQGGTLPQSSTFRGTTVSTFSIGKFEVTWREWQEVRAWALNNGYTDIREGQGSAPNDPVRTVNQYDMVKWCNARSEKEGLTPVYLINGQIWKVGMIYYSNIFSVNRLANGYRLPTEPEWEWAARGGLNSQGFTYSGSNDPDLVAWHRGNSGGAPSNLWEGRGSWPVGSKAPNELGIHDMSGNVWELVNESGGWGLLRRFRGGGWNHGADLSSLAFRDPVIGLNYDLGNTDAGFRVARTVVLAPPDADSDGVNDDRENADGTNPNDANSFEPLSKGLVAHYPMNGDSADESGNGNHAVNLGATGTTNRFGANANACSFDGISAYMDAPPLISDYQRNFTISGWLKTTHVSSDRLDEAVSALCKTRDAGDFGGPAIDFREGKAVFTFNNNRVFGPLIPFEEWEYVTPGLMADGKWRHYILSIDANGLITAFINGQQVASHQITTFLEVSGASPFQIGRAGGAHAAARYFPGQIDDVRIYNRGLTSQEASQLYNESVCGLDSDADGVTDYRENRDGTDRYDALSFNPLSVALLANYPFDDSWSDESGHCRDVLAPLTTFEPGLNGTALGLAQGDSQANYWNDPNNTNSPGRINTFSFSVWMKAATLEQANTASYYLVSAPNNAAYLRIRNGTGDNRVLGMGHEWSGDPGYGYQTPDTGVLRPLFWQHVVGVQDGEATKIYVNGSLVGSTDAGGQIPFDPENFTLGNLFNQNTFQGLLDDIRIYGRALSGAEIRQLYQLEAGALDSDDDGLYDRYETGTGIFVSATETGSDPYDSDTSNDGLLDGEVVTAGFNPNTDYTPLFNLVKGKGAADQGRIGLFTESAMMEMNLGGVTLRKTGSTVNLRLQIQSKINLNDPNWHNEGTETFILDMPGNKAFMRIRALGPQ